MKDQTEKDREKFNEGYNAFMDNKPKEANPYSKVKAEYYHRMWNAGYEQASQIEGDQAEFLDL